MYNLNTKYARVEEDGKAEWISGSFGFHIGYLYPVGVPTGNRVRSKLSGAAFAGAEQNLGADCKVVHVGKNTSSYVNTHSISKSGGISTFRLAVVAQTSAENAKSSTSCQSLVLDAESRLDTVPAIGAKTSKADMGHEAEIGCISDDAVFYLMSRGAPEEDVRALTVSGFTDNAGKKLPLEYAIEMNNLIRLEMKGAIG